MFESPGQGDATADTVAALAGADPHTVDQGARIAMLERLERARHAIDAAQQVVLAAVDDGQEADRDGDDWVREEVAAVLGVAPGTAASRLVVARGLIERFPATLAQLAAGAIGYGHARALVEETAHLDADLAAQVERRVLGKAGGCRSGGSGAWWSAPPPGSTAPLIEGRTGL